MSRNRYVKDYRLVESIDGRGRIKTDYEYIGPAYAFAGDGESVARAKRRASIGCALGWLAYVGALLPVSTAMHTPYVSLPFAFAALPLALMTGVISGLLLAKPPLEHRHADRAENRAPACSFFVCLLAGIALAGEGINALRGVALSRGDLIFSLGAALLLACGIACHRQWRHLKLREI